MRVAAPQTQTATKADIKYCIKQYAGKGIIISKG